MEPYKLRDLLWFSNLVLILAVFASSFFIIQQIRNEKEIQIPEAPPEEKIKDKSTSRLFDYEPIWAVKIGPVEKEKEVVEIQPDYTEELRGLLQVDAVAYKGVPKENAYATMKVKVSRKTSLVYIGDAFNVQKNEWLRKATVTADLVFPATVTDISGEGVTFLYKNEPVLIPPEGGAEKDPNSTGPAPDFKSGEYEPGKWKIAEEEKELIAKNPDQYIKELGLTPYYEHGRVAGLKLKNVNEGSLAEKRGFKKHDVISKINGISIQSMEDLETIAEREKSKKRFIINLMRLGKPVTLTFEIQ
ncbi:MAG: PDZ domain-containing protein [Planctomycetota bacterium]